MGRAWQGEGGIGQDEDGAWGPFSLEDLLSAGLESHLEAVAAISAVAHREWCAPGRPLALLEAADGSACMPTNLGHA